MNKLKDMLPEKKLNMTTWGGQGGLALIWIKCSLDGESDRWQPAKLSRGFGGHICIDFLEEEFSDDFENFEKYPVVAMPTCGQFLQLVSALEWYADKKSYHPGGGVGRAVYDEDLGIDVWEYDKGDRAQAALEKLGR